MNRRIHIGERHLHVDGLALGRGDLFVEYGFEKQMGMPQGIEDLQFEHLDSLFEPTARRSLNHVFMRLIDGQVNLFRPEDPVDPPGWPGRALADGTPPPPGQER